MGITFTYHPQDVYSVAIFDADGVLAVGSTFATRDEAEAYAAPLLAEGYTARGTAPSYDRERYATFAPGTTVQRSGKPNSPTGIVRSVTPRNTVGVAWDDGCNSECFPDSLTAVDPCPGCNGTGRFAPRPYRQGDPIEVDPESDDWMSN